MSLNLNAILESLETDAALEKQASTQEEVTPAVADELASVLTKKAEQDLTKAAHEQGEALAKELLAKMANEIIVNDAANISKDDSKIVPTEAAGTVEDTLQATVEEGLDRGATSDDRVDEMQDAGKGEPSGEQLPAGEHELTEKKAEQEMNDNKSLAQYIMEKLAEAGPATTADSGAHEVAVAHNADNMIQANDAANVAADDAKVHENPGTEGTISTVMEAIVARAKATGAGTDDLVNGTGHEPEQRVSEEVEKAAAVAALVDEGCDFNTAVELVKQAEQELSNEAFEQEKQAAFKTLIESGVDFNTAVDLVKQAEQDLKANFNQGGIDKEASAFGTAMKAAKGMAGRLKNDASNVAPNLKALFKKGPTGPFKSDGMGPTRTKKDIALGLTKNRAVQAGAITAGVAAIPMGGREKKAASKAEEKKLNSDAWKATARSEGSSLVHGVAGGLIGTGLTAGHPNPRVRALTALAGTVAGGVYGNKKSTTKTLRAEREKKAAYDMLVEQGVDFATATEMVSLAEKEFFKE